ncbi:RNA-directed DNA polymerase, eukaryota [Tanacetum coccineum]
MLGQRMGIKKPGIIHFASVLKSNQPNNLSSSNMIHDSSPAIALDDDCLSASDLSCVAIGKIKDINALSNLSVILNDEGFDDIKISYLGGYWGLGQSAKKQWIRELNTKNKINFVAIQETKLESINLFSIKDLWGNSFFDFSFSSSVGLSGGILCVWDPNSFVKDNATISDYFVAVRGTWLSTAKNNRLLGPIKSAKKMSKLDRFLISEGLLLKFPSLSAICLDRHLSDHRPIIMREVVTDYGPSPFRELHNFKPKSHSLDLAQKAKVRWAIEGDENSKYFHGIINKKRSQLAIRGVLIDGDWIDEPCKLQNEIAHCTLPIRFERPSGPCMILIVICSKSFSSEAGVMTSSVMLRLTRSRKRFWECGTNKSAIPDGFSLIYSSLLINSSFIALIPKKHDAKFVKDYRPISLIGCFYKIVSKILANRLKMVISELISDVQSAFVSNRQILDGPFILNELISWCKAHKSKAMIFKVDFEKAFDSGCLSSAMGSILVNGSPTAEFKFHKGLKQGDPLSPYLLSDLMIPLTAISSFSMADDASSIANGIEANNLTIFRSSCGIPNIYLGVLLFPTPFSLILVSRWDGLFQGERAWDEIIGSVSSLSPWNCILKELNSLSAKGINLLALLKKKVGNGANTLFWEDCWINDVPLSRSFPRLYALELKKGITVADKLIDASFVASFRRNPRGGVEEEQLHHLVELVGSISLSPSNDRWAWLLGSSGEFSVHSARTFIDDILLPFVVTLLDG